MFSRPLEDLLTRARIARYAGRLEEARLLYEEALAAARRTRNRPFEGRALAGLGYTALETDPARARRLLGEAIPLLTGRDRRRRVADLNLHLALACLDTGDRGEALRLLEESLPLLEAEGFELAVAFGLEVMALVRAGDDSTEALALLSRASRLRRQPGGEEASPLAWRRRREALRADLQRRPA